MNNHDLGRSAASCDSPVSSIAPAYGSKASKVDLRPGAVNWVGGPPPPEWEGWCTDGQGASWIEGSVDLHWSVIFFSGFFVGAVAVWGLWYVW